jgi:hypothetical protein
VCEPTEFLNRPQVELPEEVLASRCEDRSRGNWFIGADGGRDPFWETLRERCGKVMKEKGEERTMGW